MTMHDERRARTALRLPGIPEPVGTLAEFERLLRPRTAVPTQRYARFLELRDEPLASAAVTTRQAATHVRRILEDVRERGARVDASLAGVPLGFFSEDHGWRGIFRALGEAGPRYREYKLLALADYRRYLLHCLDALGQVSTDRLQSDLCRGDAGSGEDRTEMVATARDGYDTTRGCDVAVRDLVRLPRGTTLALRADRDGPFEIWLGKRRFRIETWSGAALVDELGQGTELHDGRNVVGRGLYNDVVVNPQFTDVSRRHLIIDLAAGLPAAVTDVSSAGTYLPRTLVRVAA